MAKEQVKKNVLKKELKCFIVLKEVKGMFSKEKTNIFFYRNTIGHIERNRVLVVGAGPVGLRLVFFYS